MARRSPFLIDGRALHDAGRLLDAGLADRRASFELSFSRLPPHFGFLVIAGVELLQEAMGRPLADPTEIERARDGGHIGAELAARLLHAPPKIDIDAMVDGTIAFANTPVAVIEGPFLEALLASVLVRAALGRATAIATRAARLCIAASDDAIIDGSAALALSPGEAIAIARAAHIGGASATTSLAASLALGVPCRAPSRLKLEGLAPPRPTDDMWGASTAEATLDLGRGDDEEARLIEAKRVGAVVGAWISHGLGDAAISDVPLRAELVAMEQNGAWVPRRGVSGDSDVVPGRKMVARCSNASGRALADIVHLSSERMQSPKGLSAVTLTTLTRPIIRAGRTLDAPEPVSKARERALTARRALPAGVAYLRDPAAYRVDLSVGLLALATR